MNGLVFDALLGALLASIAAGAVLARGVFTAVVMFLAYGLFIAVAWVRLGAIDVALAEAALGAGLTGVLLLRAAARLRLTPGGPRPVGPGRQLLAALLALALFGGLAAVVLGAPAANGLHLSVQEQLSRTGVTNPVTAVLLNFRGYDTLLETVVLLAALVGAWSVSKDAAWGGRAGVRDHAHPTGVLASFARVLPPIGLVVGLHLFWAGSSAPGGAFQAGTILATVWLLVSMAGVLPAPHVTDPRLRAAVVLGPALFLGVAAAAIPGGGLLVIPPAWAKPLVWGVEAGLTVSVAATLALLVMGPPAEAP
ncbi:DUF4040 domain-containing protein [Ramlibacter sp. AW1]|uniref:DUF4040 domain-containing protein n=1 Tax=Ramlibacter aurantiacus TaxID=2801330 RepID=A0A936ZSG0_9BURK|nr:hydrogenase subunit MbhD domain-containing protein [Ramlibacter aurantiacus]MBL0420285.1 DUF4040 domain-containing protein [Ramlibacter aurantiacus]